MSPYPAQDAGAGAIWRRSETLDPDQHAFTFEEIQTDLGAAEAKLDPVATPFRAGDHGHGAAAK
jgi:hypothetical protein